MGIVLPTIAPSSQQKNGPSYPACSIDCTARTGELNFENQIIAYRNLRRKTLGSQLAKKTRAVGAIVPPPLAQTFPAGDPQAARCFARFSRCSAMLYSQASRQPPTAPSANPHAVPISRLPSAGAP